MLHLDNTIKVMIDEVRYRTRYLATCDTCGKNRGYLTKCNAQNNPNCPQCAHKNVSEETKQKMSASRSKMVPWNKGKIGVSDETRIKMSQKKLNKSPPNKNKTQSLDTRIKLSCINRSISVDEFDDFTTEESRRERNRFTDLELHLKCFEAYDYRCDVCTLYKMQLNAHHKNSWKHYPDQRFILDNLVSLCVYCHRKFHSVYGNGKTSVNTEGQYLEFKEKYSLEGRNRKKIILVAGVSGAGKSWICNQLKDIFLYHEHDKNRGTDIRSTFWNYSQDKILYDPFSHVSTFISKNSDIFDIDLYVIIETQEIIERRLLERGGNITASVKRRIARMKHLAERARFSGTSSEVLEQIKLTY